MKTAAPPTRRPAFRALAALAAAAAFTAQAHGLHEMESSSAIPKSWREVHALLDTSAHNSRAATGQPLSTALPSLGDAGEMTPLQERKLGDRIASELYRDPDYFDDPVIVQWVDDIWQPLRQAARARGEMPQELDERYAWRVLLGREGQINAFALPGGYFGLYLGMVSVVDTRDELASVMAHEMAHVTQRHIARMTGRQSRQAPLLLAGMILGALAAGSNPQAGAAVITGGQAAMLQSQLNYSRDMEREADRIGFGIHAQAGFSPWGVVGMFEKLQHASRLSDSGEWATLRSHPLTAERLAEAARRAPKTPRPALGSDLDLAQAQIAARARVLSRPGVDKLRAWAAAAEGKPGQSAPQRIAALYSAALAEAELRNLPRARKLAARLPEAIGPDRPAAARQARLLQADLALRAGDSAQAIALLQAAPADASHRPEQLYLAQAETAAGQARQAIARLQSWLTLQPEDGAAWQLLAAARRAQSQPLHALRAEGQAHLAWLDFSGAANRFRAAQDWISQHPDADPIESAIVDTRLRETQEQLRQQQQEDKP